MNRSVSIFVLFALLATAIAHPNREQFEADKQKCIAETGIDAALVSDPPSKDEPVDDKVKCFAACMMKQRGVFKEDGSFDLDRALSKIPENMPDKEKAISAITACADKTGDNECETAHEIMMCLHEQKAPFMMHHGPHKHD